MKSIEKAAYNGYSIFYTPDGALHREDGPVHTLIDGSKFWWFHGKRHRADGPAIEFASGNKEWYYEGERVPCNSQEEFERLIKLKVFW